MNELNGTRAGDRPGGQNVVLLGAAVDIESPAASAELEATLRSVTSDGPFVVTAVERVAGDRHRCTFQVRRPGLAVGYRNVIDLQHRLDRYVHIVAVEPHRTPVAS